MKQVPVERKVSGDNFHPDTMVWEIIGYTLVDDKHYLGLIKYSWTLATRGYAKRHEEEGNIRKTIYMQDDIWCRLEGITRAKLDHKDGNPLNNQLNNLRPATDSQNGANRGLSINSTTGYKGVTWNRFRNKYQAQITVNRKSLYLGRFDTALEAAKAYDKAAIEHFKEFAITNETLGLY